MTISDLKPGSIVLELSPFGRPRTRLVFVDAGQVLHCEEVPHKDGRVPSRPELESLIKTVTGRKADELGHNADAVKAAFAVVEKKHFATPGEMLLESAYAIMA